MSYNRLSSAARCSLAVLLSNMRDVNDDPNRPPELTIRVRSGVEVAAVVLGLVGVGLLSLLIGVGSLRQLILERLAPEGAIPFAIVSGIVLIVVLVVMIWMRHWVKSITVSEDGFRVRRLLGETSYGWNEMGGFEFHRQESRSRERIPLMVPLGVGTLVGYEDIGEKISISSWVSAKHASGRELASFAPDYPFTRWLSEWKAAKHIESTGGTATWRATTVSLGKSRSWKSLTVTDVSFAGASLDDTILTQLIPILEKLPELTTLDFSQTSVTDAGIRQLATLARLERIRVRETSVSPEAVAETIQRVEKRQSAGDFAFLGN